MGKTELQCLEMYTWVLTLHESECYESGWEALLEVVLGRCQEGLKVGEGHSKVLLLDMLCHYKVICLIRIH